MKEPNSGCWLWTASLGDHGYGQIAKDGRPQTTHRISYEMHFGPIPDDKWVLHKCDTRSCVNPDHLWLGTAKDNTIDMYSKDRHSRPIGEKAPTAKLTTEDVKTIRTLTGTSEEIGRLYGVSGHQIGLIRRKQSWAHV